MGILVLICSPIIGLSAIAQDDGLPRDEKITLFNEAQRCFKAAEQDRRKRSESVRCAKSSLEIGKSLFEPDSKNIAALTYNFGLALRRITSNKTTQILSEALELYEAIHGEVSPELIDILINQGNSTRALSIAKTSFGDESILYADTLLAVAMSSSTTRDRSSRYSKESLKIYNVVSGPESVGATLANFQLGKDRMSRGNYASSIPYFLQATKNASIASYAHAFLVEAYDRTNQKAKATEHVLIMARQPNRVETENYIPLFIGQPVYPMQAQKRGREGYAVVELTVSKEGLALDPIVIEEKSKGQKFGKAALKAANSLRYVLRFVDGEPAEVPGVLYKYTFQMAR
tara:strand:- start:47 stop:1081 length:1035 start_codon:yes stop_codon:yes gene_type:complete